MLISYFNMQIFEMYLADLESTEKITIETVEIPLSALRIS